AAAAGGVDTRQPSPLRTHRPGARALAGKDLLGDGDLLLAARLVGVCGVGASAVGAPRLCGELQATVEAVSGVDRPVSAALALGDGVPDRCGLGLVGGGDATGDGRRAGDADTGEPSLE